MSALTDRWPTCFPHACGDVPKGLNLSPEADLFSPRMWGCSEPCIYRPVQHFVFPTHVGMFRLTARVWAINDRFPHACGDVPSHGPLFIQFVKFSPRMWGCSVVMIPILLILPVFPTHVGMFRTPPSSRGEYPCFPHACGDVPSIRAFKAVELEFSPRMWGCSDVAWGAVHPERVFPTHVGMFRICSRGEPTLQSFPHACGDVPGLHRKTIRP